MKRSTLTLTLATTLLFSIPPTRADVIATGDVNPNPSINNNIPNSFLSIGHNGTGNLRIDNNNLVNGYTSVSSFLSIIGQFEGSTGSATVTGPGSTWTNNDSLIVGDSGHGTLRIENGGSVYTGNNGLIGHDNSFHGPFNNRSVGSVTVTGTNSTWDINGNLIVSNEGSGSLIIEHGGTVNSTDGLISTTAISNSLVTVTGAGSSWNNSGTLMVGNGGNGTLNIQNGATVEDDFGRIGTGTVNVSNSTWNNRVDLIVGSGSLGNLNITNGGTVKNNFGFIGLEKNPSASKATATVTGPNSSWNNNNALYVGFRGDGILNIRNGATVSSSDGLIGTHLVTFFDANNTPVFLTGTGTATVTGIDSKWDVSNALFAGFEGNGTLHIENGATVNSDIGFVGHAVTSTGYATVTGPGSTWNNSGDLITGTRGTGTLLIENGGTVNSGTGILGDEATGNGTVTVTGTDSSWTNNDSLFVGGKRTSAEGTGTLNINAGGSVSTANAVKVWQNGTINIDGGTLTTPLLRLLGTLNNIGTLDLTGNGPITALILDGGTLSATDFVFDDNTLNFTTGTINLNGGTLSITTLNLPAAGTLNAAGTVAAQVQGTIGSAINATGNLTLGNANSFLGFNHAGTLDVGAHTVTLHSKTFAGLGTLTTLNGGIINAPNGVALGTGNTLSGHGAVNAAVSAGFGSTLNATGNLALGSATAVDGFFSDGRLFTNAHTVTINDKNTAVLGSLTHLGDGVNGGSLVAGNPDDDIDHFLIEQGKNLTGRGNIAGNVKNHGAVIGDGTAIDERLVFDAGWTVSGNGTFQNTLIRGTFSPGNSPTITQGTDQGFDGGFIDIELGGLNPGSNDNNHDQIIDDATILLVNNPTLRILAFNNFEQSIAIGDTFLAMTWQTGLLGTFGNVQIDSLFKNNGIDFDLLFTNTAGTGNLTLVAIAFVPEPTSAALLTLILIYTLKFIRRKPHPIHL